MALCALATSATGGTLADVLKRNALLVCAHANALPYSHDGDPEGFQIELARALAAELGVALRMRYTRMHRAPRKGECDALIAVAVPRDTQSEADYLISTPYMAYRPLLVVRQQRPAVERLEAFAPGRIAVQSGSWAHYLLTERNIPIWVRFRTDEEMMHAVENGEAEAAIVSNIGYDWYLHRNPQSPVRTATELPLDEDLGFDVAIGVLDADRNLLDRINQALARILAAGTVDAALARYGIGRIAPSSPRR